MSDSFDLSTIELDRSGVDPLQKQLFHGLRRAMLSAELPPGARLPATRTLAQQLGLGRNTVSVLFMTPLSVKQS